MELGNDRVSRLMGSAALSVIERVPENEGSVARSDLRSNLSELNSSHLN